MAQAQWQPEDPGNVLILPQVIGQAPFPPAGTLIPQLATQSAEYTTDTETDDTTCGEQCACILTDSRGWGHLAGSFSPCNGKFECYGGDDGCANFLTAGQACSMLAAGIDPATVNAANPQGVAGSYPTPCVPPWAADPLGKLNECDPVVQAQLVGCPPAFSRVGLVCSPGPGYSLQPVDASFPDNVPFATQWCGLNPLPQNCPKACPPDINGVCRCDPPLPLASDGNGFALPAGPYALPVHPVLSEASIRSCLACASAGETGEEAEAAL